jgi:hypothetical protein
MLMNPLILKKIASHYGSPWTAKDDDYVVLDAGQVIGRIMLNQHAPRGHLWLWTITARAVIAMDARGYATSLRFSRSTTELTGASYIRGAIRRRETP